MDNYIALQDRNIIEISGDDRKKFIQGLITNDINKTSGNEIIYSAMLNSQGRFLYDFFIFEQEQKLFIDCSNSRCDEILQKFNLYKLRSKIEIKKNNDLKVFWNLSKGDFLDPRNPNLGYRTYSNKPLTPNSLPLTPYHLNRISLKVPEGEYDLTYEKSFILEFDFDNLNAIDYQKGCYVGQELTARTHYKGEIRKRIFHLKISNTQNLEKNHEITCEGKTAGIILSSFTSESELHALALIKASELNEYASIIGNLELKDCPNSSKIFVVS
jgi:tRNA-modifying protein YgfZ